MLLIIFSCFFFFFNDTATTEIYTLSLHDALPICAQQFMLAQAQMIQPCCGIHRSEEHTSELQSHHDLVCRLLLEKKKKKRWMKKNQKNRPVRVTKLQKDQMR